MSGIRRLSKLIYAIFMLIGSVLLLVYPKEGYFFVVLIIDITLLIYGIRMLIYYFALARYMVGGIMTFYKSIIVLDFGMFMFNLDETPYKLVMLYLAVVMIFNAIITILGALDSKRLDVPGWSRRLAYGVVKMVLALGCLFLWNNMEVVTYVYSIALIHTALYNIATALKKSAMVYIK